MLHFFASIVLDNQTDYSILFVVSNSSSPISGDASVKTHIEARGYTVTYMDDDSLTGAETGYDCIIVSDSVSSSKISNKLKESTIPVLILEYLNLVDSCLASSVSTDTGETQWRLIDDTHRIADGYSNGLITVFSSSSSVRHTSSTSNLGSGADVVFDSPDSTGRPSIFVYESGAILTDGEVAANRRGYMPFETTNWSILNSDAKAIFDNMVDWCLGI